MALTPYLRLNKPPFDSIPWDQAINGDMDIIDGFIAQYMAVPNFGGVWANSTPYIVGQVLLDTSNSSMWIAQISHTSSPGPATFAQERTANPSYWAAGSTPLGMLPITGGTLTGNLVVAPPTGTSVIELVGASSGNGAQISGYTGVNPRWVLQLSSGEAETGGNAGSNFTLSRYSDGNTYIGTSVTINRASGAIGLNGPTTVNGLATVNSTLTANDVVSNGAVRLSVSGAYISSDATYTQWVQDSAAWRWQYTRLGGTMAYIRGSDSAPLFSINGAGAITAAGGATITGNIAATGTATTGGGIFGASLSIGPSGALRAGPAYPFQFIVDGPGNQIIQHAPGYYYQWSTGSTVRSWVTNNVVHMQLAANGDFTIPVGNAYKTGGGSWTTISDARIKDVLGDYTTGLAAVLALHPVHYKYKTGGREHVGLVAQEAETVMPEMVSTISDKYDGQQIDDLRVLDMSALPLAIVNAIKELTQRVAALEGMLADRATQP